MTVQVMLDAVLLSFGSISLLSDERNPMSKSLSKSLLTLTLVLGLGAASAQNAVTFPTSDDLTIHALEYPNPEAKAVVLLSIRPIPTKPSMPPSRPSL